MADPTLKAPGVYLRDKIVRVPPVLPTAVPAFIGLLDSPAAGDRPRAEFPRGPRVLHRKSDFPGGARALGHAVGGFFDNGGEYCYVIGVRVDPVAASAAVAALIDALDPLATLTDVDLIAIPDAAVLAAVSVENIPLALQVQAAMIRHCADQGNRIALLDAFRGLSAQELIECQVRPLSAGGAEARNAALYHPWIRTIASGARLVPPCGHIAGIIARTDARAGVFKAPANVELLDATDLEVELDPDALMRLNEAGVNGLRAFASRGIRVWGARTLSNDPAWRYLNIRRLVLTLLRWIDLNMTWAAFEPNVPTLWTRIERELTVQLTQLWRAGALQGESPAEAFTVRCDAELNPPATREIGQVVTEISLAALAPAEFIVVSVQHRAGTTELI